MATVTKPIALDESFNTTENTPRNIADVLAEELSRITGRNASQVEYDNTDSGLTADNVQDAIDEINGNIPTVPSVDIQTAVDEFETYNGGLLSSLKVSLSPNQDLHGYPNPWVGGAGKNKLPLVLADIKSANGAGTWSGNVYTYSGLTIEVIQDTNGNVTGFEFNGTPSVGFGFKITQSDIANFPTGNYIYSIQNTINMNGLWVSIYSPQSKAIFVDNQTSVAVDVTEGQLFGGGYIYTNAGNVFNNVLIQPMLRLSTESDPTFEPYSNICPISGHTQVDVDVSDGQTTQEQVIVNLGGTYYSGTLDVVSGVMNVGGIVETFDGTDESWFKANDGTPNWYYYINVNSNYLSALICDTFNNANITNGNTDTGIGMTGAGTANAYIRIRTALGELSISDWKTWLSNNNIHVYFPLATPTTIQLSPTMVKALVGENHLSAPLEGQEITESKYKQTFTFDDVIAYIQSLS